MKKTFLVTGGTGFIGSNIVKLLLKLNRNVIVFDNNSRGNLHRLKKFKNQILFKYGDIRNLRELNEAAKNADSIIHLAYLNGTKFFYTKPDLVLEVAIKGIINIFDVAKKNNIKEIFLASSSEVYQTPIKIPTDESEPLKVPDVYNPRYTYGAGKILTELMGLHAGKKIFKRTVIFRPHNVYGNDMGKEHVIPEFEKKISKINKTNSKFEIEGSGKEIRSFIHINDFIDAFEILLKKGKNGNIYNIGTTEKVSILQLAKMFSIIKKRNIKIVKRPLKKGGTKIRIPNITKIKKLGFIPKIKLKKGLEDILKN